MDHKFEPYTTPWGQYANQCSVCKVIKMFEGEEVRACTGMQASETWHKSEGPITVIVGEDGRLSGPVQEEE